MRTPVYSALAAGLASFAGERYGLRAKRGGMPQLDFHSFAPQLVWLVIAFVALYLVMSKLAVPAISDTLAKRQAKIQGDLDAAEKANEDTRGTGRRLREAPGRRARGIAPAAARAGGGRQRRWPRRASAELGERLNGRIAEAEKRIAGQRDDVMAGLEQMAGEIAQSAYAKLAGQPADQARARRQGRQRREGDQPMIGTAWAAGADAGEGGLFSDPAFWVAVAFFLFFVARRQGPVEEDRRDARQAHGGHRQGAGRRRAAARRRAEGQGRSRAARSPRRRPRPTPSSSRPARKPPRMQARAAGEPRDRRRAARAAGARPHRPVRGPATKQVRDTAVDVALVGHPRAAARAGRLGPHAGAGRRGDRRTAEPPALDLSTFESPAQNQSRATWCPRRKAGAFSCHRMPSSRPERRSERRRDVPI